MAYPNPFAQVDPVAPGALSITGLGRCIQQPKVLGHLLAAKDVADRWAMLDAITGGGRGSDEVLRQHVFRLRKILGKDAIQNVRGRGYRLSPEALSDAKRLLEDGSSCLSTTRQPSKYDKAA